MLATDYAQYYKISPQAKSESDYDFKYRVAGGLRKQGKIIEAHEAFTDKTFDQDENVITEVIGALAFAMDGKSFNGNPVRPTNGQRQIDDDFAAGVIVQNQEKKMTPEMALMMVTMFSNH